MQVKTILSWLQGRVSRNVLFWILFTCFHYSGKAHHPSWYLALLLVMLISYGLTGYVHNLWLIPGYLFKRRYGLYMTILLALLTITTVLSYYCTHAVNAMFPGLDYMGGLKDVAPIYHVFPSLLMFALLAFGKFMADSIQSQRRMEEMDKQQAESELQSLRSQINPHFLFNALNTIYGMARRTDQETSEAILKLSGILRHSLYECNDTEITLQNEIRFLEQYVAFAQLRLHNKESMKLQIDANVTGQKIAPLLLMPFIENAIKHGPGKHAKNAWVDIRLGVNGNDLSFHCANSCNKNQTAENTNIHSGIGLKNVRRRLELLYPGRHNLNIIDDPQRFSVELKMELS
jgi:two-component system LytT family sensor kinase